MSAPLLKAPPDGDVDLRGRFMAGIIVMTVIAVMFAWLRLFTRVFVSHNPWWDDWAMFAASLITIVADAFLINAYHLGLGRHAFYVPLEDLPETFKWLWAAEPTNLFAVTLVRLSIALFYLRLVPPKKRYIWSIWSVIGLLAISDIYISITFFFECRPIRKVWLQKAVHGTCFSNEVQQSGLWIFQVTRHTFKFFMSLLSKTARLELCVGMICGCIPTLRPLVLYWQRKDADYEGHEYSHPSKSSAIKLDSYGRSPKATRGPKSQYSIGNAESAFMPCTSKERMVLSHDEHRILKTQDIEVSYKSAGSARQSAEPYRTGWGAV
ncbi:MAG: hypothetical protein Q9170_004252 [Blastenia crenularia]